MKFTIFSLHIRPVKISSQINSQSATTEKIEEAEHGHKSYGLHHSDQRPKHSVNHRQTQIQRPVQRRRRPCRHGPAGEIEPGPTEHRAGQSPDYAWEVVHLHPAEQRSWRLQKSPHLPSPSLLGRRQGRGMWLSPRCTKWLFKACNLCQWNWPS